MIRPCMCEERRSRECSRLIFNRTHGERRPHNIHEYTLLLRMSLKSKSRRSRHPHRFSGDACIPVGRRTRPLQVAGGTCSSAACVEAQACCESVAARTTQRAPPVLVARASFARPRDTHSPRARTSLCARTRCSTRAVAARSPLSSNTFVPPERRSRRPVGGVPAIRIQVREVNVVFYLGSRRFVPFTNAASYADGWRRDSRFYVQVNCIFLPRMF